MALDWERRERKEAADLLAPGECVEHFKVIRRLERGGMGEIYLARDTRLGRKVALKLIRLERHDDPEIVEQFLFEARVTARFNHPNIVTIHSVGEHAGQPFVALEYIEGQDLRARMRADPPSPRQAMRIGLAIADALAEAHEHAILHRDLKPENVLLAQDGRPRVLDFGLAGISPSRRREGGPAPGPAPAGVEGAGPGAGDGVAWPPDSDLTTVPIAVPGTLAGAVGTPRYMAPEQWRSGGATEASDCWALGLILHELLDHGHPFPATGPPGRTTLADLYARICSDDPVAGIERDDVSPELARLVGACLEKDPARRPTAREIGATLRDLLRREAASRDEDGGAGAGVGVEPPFPGLFAFTERHAHLFFGREAEVDAFVERLREETVLPVVGPSGIGKSSFLQAGVVPRLREQGRWIAIALRPGQRPFQALAARLREEGSGRAGQRADPDRTRPIGRPPTARGEGAGGDDALAAELHDAPHLLALHLARLAERRAARVLLLVDQLEELFTLAAGLPDESRDRFVEALCNAADDPGGPVRVAFTLREDFLGRLASTPAAGLALRRITVLGDPDARALRDIVERPALEAGYRYEDPAMPDRMVEAVRGEPASLPVLQFACSRLWAGRDRDRKVLTCAAYEAMGGVEGALARHMDDVLGGLTAAQVALARDLLMRLVTPERTRRVVPATTLVEGLGGDAEVVLERLVEARAVVAHRGRDDTAAELELVHESLVRAWGPLARWLDEDREELAFLDEVGRAAELWERRGRRADEVWQGPALQEAAARAARCRALPERVREFLEAGRRREGRAAGRRRAVVGAALAVLALLATVLLGAALALSDRERQARQERTRAEAQRALAESRHAEALREGARAALERGDLLEARARLRTSLEISDSPLARVLWWRIGDEPSLWRAPLASWVLCVAAAADGGAVAAGAADNTVTVLDPRTLAATVLRGHSAQVNAVAFAPAPATTTLASASADGTIRLWDLERHDHLTLAGHSGPVWAVDFAADGRQLASGGQDGTVRLWDVTGAGAGRAGRALRGHDGRVRVVRFAPDGRRVASGGQDGTVRLWDPAGGAEALWVAEGHEGGVMDLDFGRDGRTVASAGHDGAVRLWAVETGEPRGALRTGGGSILSLDIDPAGRLLAAGGADGTIGLWDVDAVADGGGGAGRGALLGHASSVWDVAFVGAAGLLVSAGQDSTVRFWDTARQRRAAESAGHDGPALGLAFSPDGAALASAGHDQTVRLWDVATGAELGALRGHDGPVRQVAFAPARAGANTLLASSSHDGTVRLWDTATGAELESLEGHRAGATGLAFSPDGRVLATGSWDKLVRLWDVGRGEVVRTLAGHEHWVDEVAFSPDGATLAASGLEAIRLWDVASGRERAPLRGHVGAVQGIAFSPGPEGAPRRWSLLSAGADGAVRHWDLASGGSRELGRLAGAAYWIDLSPDGRRVGVPGASGAAEIWDVDTGSPVVTLRGHRGDVSSLRFSPDGRVAATAGDDGTVRLWEASTGRPAWRAPALLGDPPRLLTHLGWVDPGTARPAAGPGPGTAWQRAVEDRARLAVDAASGAGRTVCVVTWEGSLELWDTASDRRLREEAGPPGPVERAWAGPGSCLALGGGRAWLLDRERGLRELCGDATAASWGDAGIAVATGRQVLHFDGTGRELARARARGGAVAVAWTRAGEQVLGFEDGGIELQPAPGTRSAAPISLERTPSSPVVALVEGPLDTLFAGHASGHAGIWSRDTGAQLHSIRLHGPVEHLVFRSQRLQVATALGRFLTLDLSVLTRTRAELLREVRDQVPVLWEGGRAVVPGEVSGSAPRARRR